MPVAPAVSPRTPVDLDRVRSAAVAARVLGPLVAQGAIVRRPRATAWAERRQTDRAAGALLRDLRREHDGAPVVLRLGPRRLVLPLDAGDVGALLAGSPDPFSPATVEKRAALGHFEPDSVLISPTDRRPARRLLNEQALDTSEPVHRDADALLAAVDREAAALLAEVDRTGVLDWPTFAPAFWRTVRTVVLGESARDDHRVTDVLWTLRRAANWAYLHPRRPRLRAELADRLHAYVRRAEPGSLIAHAAAAQRDRGVDPVGQVPQWLFAFDAAGAAVLRALAVAAARPAVRERLRGEARSGSSMQPYARGAVLESVRLWPTTLVVLRDSTAPTTWGRRELPGGTSFAIVSAFAHRDAERLDFADAWSPEAWLDGRADADWGLLPFSGGPVSCPGRNVVLLVAGRLLARLSEADLVLPRGRYLATDPLPATFDHYGARFHVPGRG
ncbi:cytochrome P450 [Cellulomonas pakistanensis]|uniref:Cytochrome P450 n=1 Tax=Cellulomonas pakistanensis TaxID=992287 RepID=A0A919PAU0_9CELL|nr:cytochrome P450 [Cellulomonas pakistanensis]GIG37604.1 cytochrome P450 [Cellulomonas pakistanensis]